MSRSSPVTSPRRRLSSRNLVNSRLRLNTILKARKFLFMLNSKVVSVEQGCGWGEESGEGRKEKKDEIFTILFVFAFLDL